MHYPTSLILPLDLRLSVQSLELVVPTYILSQLQFPVMLLYLSTCLRTSSLYRIYLFTGLETVTFYFKIKSTNFRMNTAF